MITARSNGSFGIKNKPFKVLVCLVTLVAFLFNAVSYDLSWAVGTPSGLPGGGSDRAGGSGLFKELHVDTFILPEYLGYIKDQYKASSSNKIIIHIQDAHCNYYAQHRISEIIEYLNREYGINSVNLEGGARDYDLSIFTDIADKNIREKVADYFVKEGLVNGSEYYAINNPDKVSLWGIEDTKLYIDNLNIYRNSLKYKDEVEKSLKALNYILNNLKIHIYSRDLLELDRNYAAYKAGSLEFKDYLNYLIQLAKSKALDIKAYKNIYLLNQTLGDETNIDFKKANIQRDQLIDILDKKLSQKEMTEVIAKTIEFKTEKISQSTFYSYLAKKAKSIDLDLKNFPELQKYIIYVSIYDVMDKTKVMKEVEILGDKTRESLYQNDEQKELDKLSKNLALLKNIFNISLTKEDYKYYKDNEAFFDVRNYVSFINKEAPLYKIYARLDNNSEFLDRYREEMTNFYEYSLKRDQAFLKNIKVSKNAIIVTGGFHTDNLAELFKKQNISYISIMPNFKNCDGYECPYFRLLAGQKMSEAKPVNASTLAYYGRLNPEIDDAVGVNRVRFAADVREVARSMGASASGLAVQQPTPVTAATPAQVVPPAPAQVMSKEKPPSILNQPIELVPVRGPFIKKYSAYIYIFSTVAATLFMSAIFSTFIDWSKSNIFVVAANIIFITVLNYNIVEGIATKALSFTNPLILPGVDVKNGIPQEFKTISYYPILLRSESELRFFDENLIPSIENNNDPNIKWVVLSTSPEGIRELERNRILDLQKKYGLDKIFYIHRDASMNNWEKKRGGYMHFMLWLKNSLRSDGTLDRDPRFPACPTGKVFDEILGDISALKDTKNLTMADSDTIWTKDSIRGIVAKIEHPSNKEYGIFQSKVEPYNTEESILTKYSYQILKKYRDRGTRLWRANRQVNFIGHGAGWNIDRFLSDMAGKIKDGYLSHDIIEGIFSKTALTEDIVTLEEMPPNLFLQTKQWSRWWKGNKLSFAFFKKEVPDESGKLVKNQATLINKYLLYLSTKNYFSNPILLALILTNMIFANYIFYESPTLLKIVYGVVISFEFYGSVLTGNGSVGNLYKSVRSLIMFVLLAPVNVIEVSIIVTRSYIDDIKNKIRKTEKKLEWAPQGGLAKDLTLKQSYSNLKYIMLFAIASIYIYHNYMGTGLYYFFGALLISPIIAWYTSRAPPVENTKNKNISSISLRAKVAHEGLKVEDQKHPKTQITSSAAGSIIKELLVLLAMVTPIIYIGYVCFDKVKDHLELRSLEKETSSMLESFQETVQQKEEDAVERIAVERLLAQYEDNSVHTYKFYVENNGVQIEIISEIKYLEERYAEYLKSCLNMLPENHTSWVRKIVVLSEKRTKEIERGNTAGLHLRWNDSIILNERVFSDRYLFEYVFTHEIAHSYFSGLTDAQRNEWHSLYMKSGKSPENFVCDYAMKNLDEDFAETYAKYCTDSNKLIMNSAGILSEKVLFVAHLFTKDISPDKSYIWYFLRHMREGEHTRSKRKNGTVARDIVPLCQELERSNASIDISYLRERMRALWWIAQGYANIETLFCTQDINSAEKTFEMKRWYSPVMGEESAYFFFKKIPLKGYGKTKEIIDFCINVIKSSGIVIRNQQGVVNQDLDKFINDLEQFKQDINLLNTFIEQYPNVYIEIAPWVISEYHMPTIIDSITQALREAGYGNGRLNISMDCITPPNIEPLSRDCPGIKMQIAIAGKIIPVDLKPGTQEFKNALQQAIKTMVNLKKKEAAASAGTTPHTIGWGGGPITSMLDKAETLINDGKIQEAGKALAEIEKFLGQLATIEAIESYEATHQLKPEDDLASDVRHAPARIEELRERLAIVEVTLTAVPAPSTVALASALPAATSIPAVAPVPVAPVVPPTQAKFESITKPIINEIENKITVGELTGSQPAEPFANSIKSQEYIIRSIYSQRETIREVGESNVLAVVIIDDEQRLKDLEGVGAINITGTSAMAERLVSKGRNSRVVYVKTVQEAIAKMGAEGRTWANTFFFVETNIANNEKQAYDSLKTQGFVWNLNIPDKSLCSVTPLGFLMFSLKFNDLLKRIQQGSEDLDMKPLAEIMLRNIGEDVTDDNIQQVIEKILRPIAEKFAQNKDPIVLLKDFSGKFTWNLPKIEPKDWSEVKKYFDTMKQVYTAL